MKHLRTWLPALALLISLLILVPNPVSAQGSSACSQAPNCDEQFEQTGTYTVPTYITKIVLKAGQTTINIDPTAGNYDDGCYRVEFASSQTGGEVDTVTWERISDGPSCQEISNVEIWWWVSPTAITLKSVSASSPGQQTAGNIAGWALIAVFALLTFALWYGFGGRKVLKEIGDHYRYRWGRRRR